MGGQFTLAMISFLGRDLPGSGHQPSDDDDDDEVDGNDDDIVDPPGKRATSEWGSLQLGQLHET